jgi:hypothetical protein
MDVCGGGKIRDEFARAVRFDVQKRGDFIIERKPPDAPGHKADADTKTTAIAAKSKP